VRATRFTSLCDPAFAEATAGKPRTANREPRLYSYLSACIGCTREAR